MQTPFNSANVLRATLIFSLAVTTSACNVEAGTTAVEPSSVTNAPLAAPLAKPHKKLGVEMSHLAQSRGASLLKQARQRELLVKEGHLLVQVAYEGREEDLVGLLEGQQIPILHRFSKFQRLDIGLRSYKDLDAVIGLGSIYRIEALSAPMSRTDPP